MPDSPGLALGRRLFAVLTVLVFLPGVVSLVRLVFSGPPKAVLTSALGLLVAVMIWWFVWDGHRIARWFFGALAAYTLVLFIVAASSSGLPDAVSLLGAVLIVVTGVVLVTPNPVTRYLDARRARSSISESVPA